MATVEHMIQPEPAQLRTALGVERWVAQVAAAGPYPDLPALLAAASAAADPLAVAEIEEALTHHPRIGERPQGSGADAAHSRREQSSADADDPALAERIRRGNAAYEQRFGRIFLIRAAGRSRAEIAAELDRRLSQDDAAELATVGEQLREIAVLRLAEMLG